MLLESDPARIGRQPIPRQKEIERSLRSETTKRTSSGSSSKDHPVGTGQRQSSLKKLVHVPTGNTTAPNAGPSRLSSIFTHSTQRVWASNSRHMGNKASTHRRQTARTDRLSLNKGSMKKICSNDSSGKSSIVLDASASAGQAQTTNALDLEASKAASPRKGDMGHHHAAQTRGERTGV